MAAKTRKAAKPARAKSAALPKRRAKARRKTPKAA